MYIYIYLLFRHRNTAAEGKVNFETRDSALIELNGRVFFTPHRIPELVRGSL